MFRRRFLLSLAAGLPTVFSLPLLSQRSEKAEELSEKDKTTFPKIKTGFAELTIAVKILNVRHNIYEPGSPSRTGSDAWITQKRHENVIIKCKGYCLFDEFDLELYFTDRFPLQEILSDLTEGSNWVVSGAFTVISGNMNLFGPRYRLMRADEMLGAT